MAITLEQIHATASQLHEQGIKPTLAEVRKVLGGGSFTTISEAMKSWRQDHQDEQQLQQVTLPSGITERLQTLGADVWQTAIDMANDRLVKEREALDIVKVKAQAETDEAQEAVKTLEGEQADLLMQLDEATSTAETATKVAAQATAERDTFKQTLGDAQHQLELERTKTDTAQTQLAEVRNALDKASVELRTSLSKVARLEATADSDKAEIERLSAEAKVDRVELKKVTAERDKISTTTAEIRGELKAVIAERDSQKTINESILSTNEKLTKANATLEAERKALDQALSDLTASYKAEQEKVGALTIEIEKVRKTTSETETIPDSL
mgnify:CR=1 FL=1